MWRRGSSARRGSPPQSGLGTAIHEGQQGAQYNARLMTFDGTLNHLFRGGVHEGKVSA